MMSTKAETKPPVFDNTAAEQRKAKELYGEGYTVTKSNLTQKEKT
jgi:hypothetical protein